MNDSIYEPLPHYTPAGWLVRPEKRLPVSVMVVGFIVGAALALAAVINL